MDDSHLFDVISNLAVGSYVVYSATNFDLNEE